MRWRSYCWIHSKGAYMKNKAALIIAIIFFVLTFTLLLWPMKARALSVKRYATKTVELTDAQGVKVAEVKMNTRLDVVAQNSKVTTVNYNGQPLYVKTTYLHEKKAVNKWKGKSFKRKGRGRWNKCSWTWYSTRQSCGKVRGVKGKHIGSRGFVFDKDGYIVLASGRKNKKKRVIVPTPFGYYGKVYDTNGRNNNKWFDVYTNW